jgi:hypothetical protein
MLCNAYPHDRFRYTASGTSTSTANQEVDYPQQHQNTWFRTEFNVTQDRGMCVAGEFDTVPHLKQHGSCRASGRTMLA